MKQQIRKEYKYKRNMMSSEQVQEYSEDICRNLLKMDVFQQAEVVFFYYPLGNEVNLLTAAKKAVEMGKTVGFPKTEGDVIRFYPVDSLEDFVEGCFHVMEPISQLCFEKEALQGRKHVMLIPGVAFDKKRNRMGYGRGYYDKYMEELQETIKIGIAYELQIAEELPVDKYDVVMDYLVTEKGIFQ